MGRPKKNHDDSAFPAKYAKVLGEEWMKECDSSDMEDLKKKIVDAEKAIGEQEALKKADEGLKDAQANVKALSAGYKEAMFYQKAKIKYALMTLESRGMLSDKDA